MVISSCGNDEASLRFGKNIKFELDSGEVYPIQYLQYSVINNIEYLVFLNPESNEINYFDYLTREHAGSTNLTNEGEKYHGFYVHNFDSIFLLEKYSGNILLIDSTGKLMEKYRWLRGNFDDFTRPPGNNFIYEPYTYSFNPIVYNNGQIYVPNWSYSIPQVNDSYGKSVNFSHLNEVSTHFIYSINEGSVTKINNNTGIWPESYTGEHCFLPSGVFPSRAINNKNELVFSFGADPFIYIYNSGHLIRKELAKSKYPYKFEELENIRTINPENWARLEVEQSVYWGILYDKFRDVYYRIYRHPLNYKNKDGSINKVFDNEWSVIILDNEFSIIGETKMPARRYLPRNILVVSEGLLIDNNHELSENFTKSEYSFTLFKLECAK